MADKDWLKSFPRGYKKIAEYIEMGSFDVAIIELEKKISKKLDKNEAILRVISNIADEVANSGLLFKPPLLELDKLSSKHLASIQANLDWKNYAKEAVKSGVFQKEDGDYKQLILSHFLQKATEKECTERIWNTSPLEKEHSFKVKEVRKKIRSEEFKQKIQFLVSRLTNETCGKLGNSKTVIENPKIDHGRFNFLNLSQKRGVYAN